MSELRTRLLDDRRHKGHLWRSDWTNTLYRYNRGWQMYYEGGWQDCHSDYGNAYYELVGQCGEHFVRVAKVAS